MISRTYVPATGGAGFDLAHRLRAHALATSGGGKSTRPTSQALHQNGPERASLMVHSPYGYRRPKGSVPRLTPGSGAAGNETSAATPAGQDDSPRPDRLELAFPLFSGQAPSSRGIPRSGGRSRTRARDCPTRPGQAEPPNRVNPIRRPRHPATESCAATCSINGRSPRPTRTLAPPAESTLDAPDLEAENGA